jgi:hypothetical protein
MYLSIPGLPIKIVIGKNGKVNKDTISDELKKISLMQMNHDYKLTEIKDSIFDVNRTIGGLDNRLLTVEKYIHNQNYHMVKE